MHCLLHQVRRHALRPAAGDVGTFFGHRLDGDGIDRLPGAGAGAAGMDGVTVEGSQVAGGHLGATEVWTQQHATSDLRRFNVAALTTWTPQGRVARQFP